MVLVLYWSEGGLAIRGDQLEQGWRGRAAACLLYPASKGVGHELERSPLREVGIRHAPAVEGGVQSDPLEGEEGRGGEGRGGEEKTMTLYEGKGRRVVYMYLQLQRTGRRG